MTPAQYEWDDMTDEYDAESASEMIQIIAVALRAGATMQQFTNTMAVHPTLGEESPRLTESEIVANRSR